MTALVVLGYVITVGALIDAVRRPSYAWVEADRNRVYWVSGLVFGLLFLPIGVALAVCYAIGVLPRMTGSTGSDVFRRRP
jgi:hypothetical protein